MFYRKTVLDNGMTIISETIEGVRSVALGIWFAVGSRDEAPHEAGMSHFMEHMMFKGTPDLTAAEISESFDRIGAELNAFTGKEYTCYYSRMVDEHLPAALTTLSTMVRDSLFADDACASERQVVIEEIARMEDTPDDRIHELFGRTLWPDHPIGLPILGSRETVGSFDHEAAVEFRARHYLTGNAVVAAAGSVDHDALVEMVGDHLELPVGPRTKRPAAASARTTRLAVLRKDTEQAHIILGHPALNAHHPDRFTLAVIDNVVGGGMSSRLFQEIREKRGLAYAVYSFHALYGDTGQWSVYAGTRPSNCEQVIRLIQTELDRVRESGITAEELDRARQSIKGHLVLGLESTRNRMTKLGKNLVTGGELLSVDEVVARIDAVDDDDVRRVVDECLSTPPVLAVIGPFEPTELEHLV